MKMSPQTTLDFAQLIEARDHIEDQIHAAVRPTLALLSEERFAERTVFLDEVHVAKGSVHIFFHVEHSFLSPVESTIAIPTEIFDGGDEDAMREFLRKVDVEHCVN